MSTAEPTTTACATVARHLVAARVIAPDAPWHAFAGGADNTVFATRAVDGTELIVKVARRDHHPRYALARWAASRLAAAGVPVPATRWCDDGALVEVRCPGKPLSATRDEAVARAAGRLLRQIHTVPVTGYGRLHPGGTGQHATVHAWLLNLPSCDDSELAHRARAALQAQASRLATGAPRLLHGDWTARHVIIDATGTITGVVDLESVRGGDPLTDLAGWSLQEPAPLTAALLDGYFPAGPSRAQCSALAVYRVRIALSLLHYHHAHGDADGVQLRTGQLNADLVDLNAHDPRAIPTITPHPALSQRGPS